VATTTTTTGAKRRTNMCFPSSAASGVAARKALRYRRSRERVNRPPRAQEGAGMATPTSIEDYLAALPEEQRAALEELRETIRAAAPPGDREDQLRDAGVRTGRSVPGVLCGLQGPMQPLSGQHRGH